MAGHKDIELPDAFDRLLRREMSIEPSPAFLPRVRERIDAQPAPARWRLRLWLPGASAAAACVIAVLAVALQNRPFAPAAPPAPVLQISLPIGAPPMFEVAEPSGARPPQRRTIAAEMLPRVPPAREPAVIVDARQRHALITMVRMLLDGRLGDRSFEETPPALQPIRESVVPIGVRPVELNLGEVGGVLQSDK